MNKGIVIGICILCLTASGCGNTSSTPKETPTNLESEVSVNTDITVIDSEKKEETKGNSNAAESNVAWRQFLKDYEAWVDSYVEFMEKYKDNSTDMSLISDYAKFVQQTAEWAEKAEKYQSDLENASPEILGEYVETLGRITKRIVEIAY